jgi:cyclohexanecarboxylate-CoA ligase
VKEPAQGDPVTLAALIESGSVSFAGTRLVFHTPEGTTESTIGRLTVDARRAAAALQALGLARGDTVACQLGNSPEYVALLYACLLLGIALVPVIAIYGRDELSHILTDSGASVLVVPRRSDRVDFVERVRELGEVAPATVIYVSGDGADGTSWDDFIDIEPIGESVAVVASDPSVIIYTSGTTSRPKGVLHTQASILWEVTATLRHMGWDHGMTLLNPSPAGHMTAVLSALRPVAFGIDTVYMSKWIPKAGIDLIHRYGAIGFTATAPYFISSLLDEADRTGADLSPLKECNVGGAAVPPSLIERADRRGLVAFRSYGSSEHPTISQGSRFDSLADRVGSDGRVTPGGIVRIVGDEGGDLPFGADGEILTQGPEQFSGYLHVPLSETPLVDGWFATGDIGRIDERGFLTVTGRKKDIIIRGGENLSAGEIEEVLARHPAVMEAAVVGMPDERLGEKVCAFVVLNIDASLDLDDVRAHFASQGLAIQKTPERLELVVSFPRTATNKVRKDELRARLADPVRSGK